MHKCSDLIQPVARKRLETFITNFSLETNSFAKFIRSAQLHSLALRSNSDENQIINLWIALESLIPAESKSEDVSNIEHIASSLLPFLNMHYLDRLLNNLVKDLLRWNARLTRDILRPVPGRKFTDKLGKLIALSEFFEGREKLVAAFKDFHLLKDRFSYFQFILESPQNVVDALDAHAKRIEWQIRRIYRTRNIIVHSGRTPAYTRHLIEHTHDYLDIVLLSLVQLASTPKSINSVAQGFKLMELKYKNHCEPLKTKGLKFDIQNIDTLLFDR